MDRLDMEREIFGMLFKTSNGLQVYLDHLLKPDKLTAKQMFLMIVIFTFGQDKPTLKEVAIKSSSSYQNVKQLALKLQKEGYVDIVQDHKDGRKKLLSLTEKAEKYWQQREGRDLEDMDQLFRGCQSEDLEVFLKVMNKLQTNIEGMEA